MAHTQLFGRLLLGLVSSIALTLSAVGCTTEVSGGDDGDGGGGGGGGGGETCAEYTGEGCTPDEQRGCVLDPPVDPVGSAGTQQCYIVQGCETAWSGCGPGNTPLVLSFEGGSVDYVKDAEHGFDVNGNQSITTDWPTSRTPWLALDRDQDGAIEDGTELFGSMSPIAGGRAPNGFLALRALDDDRDGRISAEDAAFSRLLVWADRDSDRQSKPGELAPLSSFGVTSIDLAYHVLPRCDARGNCEMERAAFRFVDETGKEREGVIIDVHLAAQR